jgi:hypothetical protein
VLDAYQRALAATEVDSLLAKEVETVNPLQITSLPTSRAPAGPQFVAIDDVPKLLMQSALTDAIQSYGAMPLDDLIQAVARKLGFHRTGSRIRDRLGEEIKTLERNGTILTDSDGRFRLRANAGGAS